MQLYMFANIELLSNLLQYMYCTYRPWLLKRNIITWIDLQSIL